MLLQLILTLTIISPALSVTYLNEAQKWGYGILTSFCLGMVGFVAAIILVQLGKWLKSDAFKACIKFFFSLACGTLLGDAVIHILSEAYADQHLNSYIVSLILILSIVAFLVLEKIFVKCGVAHEHWVGEEGHHHHHDDHDHGKCQKITPQSNEKVEQKRQVNLQEIKPASDIQLPASGQIMIQSNIAPVQENLENDQTTESKGCLESIRGKGTAGYLNLIGSTIHNTIDGLSIGLAFSAGVSTVYVPIVIAIFIHEIPRQLGDVAILLKSKFSNWQTICSNGLINLLAIVGAIIGLATNNLSDEAKNYIMVFVAGNFIYIASDIWRHLFNSTWKSNLLEALGFAIGVGAMFAIKTIESDQQHGHGAE